MNKEVKSLHIVGLVCALLMVISIFLPYMTNTGYLSKYNSSDYEGIYIYSASELAGKAYDEAEGSLMGIVTLLFGALLCLTAFFAIRKKPIVTIIFDLLTFCMFLFFNTIMKHDFLSSDKYTWGFAPVLTCICIVVMLMSNIGMIIAKNGTDSEKSECET